MNTISFLLQFALVALCLFAALWTLRSRVKGFRRSRGVLQLVNLGAGTHQDIRKLTDAAVATRNLLGKHGSDANHVAICGVADIPFCTIGDEATAAEKELTCFILGIEPRTLTMVSSEAIDEGEAVYTAAAGKIQDLPAGAGTYYFLGYAMHAVAGADEPIEVQHCVPIKLVIP